jgi:hypothetical protein
MPEMSRHRTVTVPLPRAMRRPTADIDELLGPIIRECWRLGLQTAYSCQGTFLTDAAPSKGLTAQLAYISFESRLHAMLFVGLSGPSTWTYREYAARRTEIPRAVAWSGGVEHWALEGGVVRFPTCDIPRIHRHLKTCSWTVADLLGAALARVDPSQAAPHRICAGCGGPIPRGKRRDAKYCERPCQLAARDRRVRRALGPEDPL